MERICEVCGYGESFHKDDGHSHKFVASDLLISEPSSPPASSDSTEVEVTDLERDLASVLNKHSAENGSNTPDFILAEYLIGCLKAYNTATKSKNAWNGNEYLNAGTTDKNP